MACTCPDVHLLAQGVLYIVIFLLGFPVAVPLLVTYINFDKKCMFYAEFTNTHPIIRYTPSNSTNCNYPIGVGVLCCIVYGLGMAVYYWKAIARRDPDAGSRMYAVLPLVVNCGMGVAVFISSCIISVGFKMMCDGLEKALGHTLSCIYGEKVNWNVDPDSHVNGETFYSCFKVAEIASWTCFLAFGAQGILGILRLYRNRRSGETTGSSRQPADMGNFAAAEPTA